MSHVIEDRELGRIVVQVNRRNKRMVFRAKSDAIHASVPRGCTWEELYAAVDKLRDQLRADRQAVANMPAAPLIDFHFSMDTKYFKLIMKPETIYHGFLACMEPDVPNVVVVNCPPDTDFSDKQVQKWLQKAIHKMMRQRGLQVLTPRVEQLAAQYGFHYNVVKVSYSRGRWGSCSNQKNIGLSCYVLFLPEHLIDYVVLHELCHTVEMNHSERFWALLDRCTDGKALALREELKNYHTNYLNLV